MSNNTSAILKETQAFASSWNDGDAKTAASFFTDDGVRIGASGDKQNGRVEIEAAYNRLMHQTMLGAQLEQEKGTIRMLTPRFAIWQAGIEIIPPGNVSPIKGYVVQIMKKVEGRWLILESHPKLFP